LQAVAFFESHAAAWERNAGAITFWLREYHAGDDPCDWRFWPTPCESYKRSRTAKAAPSQPWQGRDGQATAIVREARQRGLSDEQILAALAEKGLRWPGDNHQPKESLT
jgi:hypothetical protein